MVGEGTATDELRLAEARFRVSRDKDAITEIVAAAVELLVAPEISRAARAFATTD
jgi:hypothetical protein